MPAHRPHPPPAPRGARRADRPALPRHRRADAHPPARRAARRADDHQRAHRGARSQRSRTSPSTSACSPRPASSAARRTATASAARSPTSRLRALRARLRRPAPAGRRARRSCSPAVPHERRLLHARRGWPLERVLFALAGTVTLLSAALAALVSPWCLLLAAFVGVNQWLFVVAGDCRPRCCSRGSSASSAAASADRLAPTTPMPQPLATARSAGSAATPPPTSGRRPRLGRGRRRPRRPRARASSTRSPAPAGRPPAPSRCRSASSSTASSAASRRSALMVVVHSPTDRRPTRRSRLSSQRPRHAARPTRAVTGSSRRGRAQSISRDGHTAVVQAGAGASSNEMVRAADDLKERARRDSAADGVQVSLTGASGMWSDFNEANRTAMMKSELISWPVTLAILRARLRLARRRRAAADADDRRPGRSAGSLYLGTQLLDISIWAMNFALMFALALGIDYALFIVDALPRRALRLQSLSAERRRRDDGHGRQGRPVLRPHRAHLADRGDARAVARRSARWRSGSWSRSSSSSPPRSRCCRPCSPSSARGSTSSSLPWVHSGEHRSPRFAAWAERLWRRPLPTAPSPSRSCSPCASPCSG